MQYSGAHIRKLSTANFARNHLQTFRKLPAPTLQHTSDMREGITHILLKCSKRAEFLFV
jgi:hypothetical protein